MQTVLFLLFSTALAATGTALAFFFLHRRDETRLPLAVPLAFGEEDPARRIKAVLTYKAPGVTLVVIAVVAAVCTGCLLLVDGPDRLDGDPITRGRVLISGSAEFQDIPADLRRDLVVLFGTHASSRRPSDRVFSTTNRETRVLLFTSSDENHPTYCSYEVFRTENGLYLRRHESFGEALLDSTTFRYSKDLLPAYDAWKAELDQRLTETTP